MTLTKLQRVLQNLTERNDGKLPGGTIYCSIGGELELCFAAQLPLFAHQYLRRVGFVFLHESTTYIYRPLN